MISISESADRLHQHLQETLKRVALGGDHLGVRETAAAVEHAGHLAKALLAAESDEDDDSLATARWLARKVNYARIVLWPTTCAQITDDVVCEEAALDLELAWEMARDLMREVERETAVRSRRHSPSRAHPSG